MLVTSSENVGLSSGVASQHCFIMEYLSQNNNLTTDNSITCLLKE